MRVACALALGLLGMSVPAFAAADPAVTSCAIAAAPPSLVESLVNNALDDSIAPPTREMDDAVQAITIPCLGGRQLPEQAMAMTVGYTMEAITRDGVRRRLVAGGWSVAPLDKLMGQLTGMSLGLDGPESRSLDIATDKAISKARGKAAPDPALDKAARVYMSLTNLMRLLERHM